MSRDLGRSEIVALVLFFLIVIVVRKGIDLVARDVIHVLLVVVFILFFGLLVRFVKFFVERLVDLADLRIQLGVGIVVEIFAPLVVLVVVGLFRLVLRLLTSLLAHFFPGAHHVLPADGAKFGGKIVLRLLYLVNVCRDPLHLFQADIAIFLFFRVDIIEFAARTLHITYHARSLLIHCRLTLRLTG